MFRSKRRYRAFSERLAEAEFILKRYGKVSAYQLSAITSLNPQYCKEILQALATKLPNAEYDSKTCTLTLKEGS